MNKKIRKVLGIALLLPIIFILIVLAIKLLGISEVRWALLGILLNIIVVTMTLIGLTLLSEDYKWKRQ